MAQDLRITGGDITDLIDRSKIDFLGHVGILEQTEGTDRDANLKISYTLVGGGFEGTRRTGLSYSAVDSLMNQHPDGQYLPIIFLGEALRLNGMFLARANLAPIQTLSPDDDSSPGFYSGEDDPSKSPRTIGHGDLYQLKLPKF